MVEGDIWELYNADSRDSTKQDFTSDKNVPDDTILYQLELLRITAMKRSADRCNLDTLNGCDDSEKNLIIKYGDDVERMSKEMERIQMLVDETVMKEELRDKLAAKGAFLLKLKKWTLDNRSRGVEL
jgi:hypothetical protein